MLRATSPRGRPSRSSGRCRSTTLSRAWFVPTGLGLMPCVRFVIFGSNSDYARVGEWFDRVLCAKADFKDEIPDISSGCLNLPTNAYSKQLFGGVAGGSPRTAVPCVDNEFGQPVAPTQHSRCRSRTRCRTRTSAGSRPGDSPRTAVHYVNEHGQSVADSAQEVHYVNEHGQPVADPAQERCSTSRVPDQGHA